MVKAAAGNIQSGWQVMQLLREQREGEVRVAEEIVRAAARNSGSLLADLVQQYKLGAQHDVNKPWNMPSQTD